jgi:GDP-4-dehydro-6-deoxy-D-mannose reductase
VSALVTGATGFSGRALLEYLRSQHVEVHALSTRGARPGVEAVDFTNVEAVARVLGRIRPKRILHLSGALGAPDLNSMVKANIQDAAVLLDAVRLSGIDVRLLMVGSAAEYGPVEESALPATEDLPARPVAPYGCTKLAQTHIALTSTVPVVVARPANIIGPGMPRELAFGRFAAELANIVGGRQEPVLRVGDLSPVRDMIDVRDAVRIYWELLDRGEAMGQVVNVGTGTGVTIADALEALIRAFEARVSVVQEGAGSARSGGASAFIASRRRLEKLIGKQEFIPLNETMARVAADALSI